MQLDSAHNAFAGQLNTKDTQKSASL